MKKKRNLKWLFVLVLAMTMILAACAGGSGNEDKDTSKEPDKETDKDTEVVEDEEEEEDATEEVADGGGDLVIAVLSDASSLDPAGSNDVPSSVVQANIYETLVNRDDDNNIIEGLAESWEAIDDTTYEFKLRQNVKFHDGEPFTAEAVKANLDRIRDPEVASPRFFLFEMITDVTAVDEHTVRITTEYPFAPLLAHLSHNGGGMVSPKSIEADYAAITGEVKAGSVITEKPVGTGFFVFESWTPGSGLS